MKAFVKELFEKEWDMHDKVLCVMNAALMGLVVGFVFSPIKKGMQIWSHNGCNNGCNSGNNKGIPEKKEKADKEKKKKNQK